MDLPRFCREIPKGIKVLERAKSALIDLGKKDLAEKTDEKIKAFQEFMKSLDESLKIEDLPQTKFNPIYTGSIADPIFSDIYAPLDGFVVNGGFKIKL